MRKGLNGVVVANLKTLIQNRSGEISRDFILYAQHNEAERSRKIYATGQYCEDIPRY